MTATTRARSTGSVLFVVGQLKSGGLERQLHYLVPRFNTWKSQIAVWNYDAEDRYAREFRNRGIPVDGFPAGKSSLSKLLQLRRMVRQTRPGIVHSYSFFTNFPAFFASFGTDSIPVGAIRSNFLDERRRAGAVLGRLCARWPRVQIANNQSAKDNALALSGAFRPAQIEVVRNGLDLDSFTPSGKVPSEPTIVAVGSLIRDKRWERLLEAVSVLKRRGLEFRARLIGDGPLRADLVARVRELGIADRIDLTGERHDIPALLSESSFLVHTSDREGCPNVVMEAMACGRAVVATDAGDVPYLVEEGRTGYVTRRGDDAALVARIGELIGDQERCQAMGKAGRTRAEREFSLDQLVARTLHAYRAAGCTRFDL